jgi:CRP-like cAMP-binding protein
MVVLVSLLSKMNATITELRRCTAEYGQKKRLLNGFLVRYNVPLPLSNHINFVFATAFQKRSRASQESVVSSMFSTQLRQQLREAQYGSWLEHYPLFYLMHVTKPDVFRCLCDTATVVSFDPGDVVFHRGSWMEAMLLTMRGKYTLTLGTKELSATRFDLSSGSSLSLEPLPAEAAIKFKDELRIFGNISLYTRADHSATLVANSTAEALQVTPHDFVRVTETSSMCTGMVCEYARLLLSGLVKNQYKVLETSYMSNVHMAQALQTTTAAMQLNEVAQCRNIHTF